MRLVLASSSPRRRELLSDLGLQFEVIKPAIDENHLDGETPIFYVNRMSREKASAVAQQLHDPGVVVLAADTVVLAADTIGLQGSDRILGKPDNPDHARRMLQQLREQPHTVYTAFRLLRIDQRGEIYLHDDLIATEVIMRDYTDDEIEAYIKSGDPFDKAGGYAIQNRAFHPVSEIVGCYTNVVGLPMCAVKRGLAKFGWYGLGVSDRCDCLPYFQPI